MSFLFKKRIRRKKKANALYCIGYCQIAATAVGSARSGSVHDKCAGGGNYRSRRAKRPAACLLAWRWDLSRRGFSDALFPPLCKHPSIVPSPPPPLPQPRVPPGASPSLASTAAACLFALQPARLRKPSLLAAGKLGAASAGRSAEPWKRAELRQSEGSEVREGG